MRVPGRLLLLLLLLLLLTTFTIMVHASLPIGTIRQDSVALLRTRPLKATCTLEGDLDTVTARNITFKLRKRTLNPRYVRVVNDSLAILTHDPRNFFDSGQLRCMIGKEQMDAVYIYFGDKPWKARNVTAVVDNWKSLLITWIKKINKTFPTNFTINWKHGSKNRMFKDCKKRKTQQEVAFECKVPLPQDIRAGYFTVEVVLKNVVGITSSGEKIFYFLDIVIPGPVKSLRVVDVGPRWAHIGWEAPSTAARLEYQVSHKCNQEKIDVHHVMRPGQKSMLNETIHNLHPHVECQISVRAKSEDSQRSGPYSKVLCQTKSAVPSAHPEVAQGGYELTPGRALGGPTQRTLHLYWKPLPEKYHNGVLTDYAIYGLKNVVNVSQRHFHHALPLDDVATYELYVKAVNEMGVNLTQPEVIQILPQSEVPKGVENLTVISGNTSSAHVNWTHTRSADCWFSLFWCKGHHKVCNEPLNWQKNVSAPWTLVLPRDESIRHYHVGVSVQVGPGSSGIVWSDCIYRLTAVLERLKDGAFHIRTVYVNPLDPNGIVWWLGNPQFPSSPPTVNVTSVGRYSVELMLVRASGCGHSDGFVYAYLIQYCMGETDQCSGTGTNLTLPMMGPKMRYKLKGLKEGTKYSIQVYSLTAASTRRYKSLQVSTTVLYGLRTWEWILIAVIVGMICLIFCAIGIIKIVRCNQRLAKKFLEGTHQVVQPEAPNIEPSAGEVSDDDDDTESLTALVEQIKGVHNSTVPMVVSKPATHSPKPPIYNIPPSTPEQCPDRQNLQNLMKHAPDNNESADTESDSDSSSGYRPAGHIIPGDHRNPVLLHHQCVPQPSTPDPDSESDTEDIKDDDSSSNHDDYSPAFICPSDDLRSDDLKEDDTDVCQMTGDGASDNSSNGYSSAIVSNLNDEIFLDSPPARLHSDVPLLGLGFNTKDISFSPEATKPKDEMTRKMRQSEDSGDSDSDFGYSTTNFMAL